MSTALVFTDEKTLPKTLVGAVFQRFGLDLEARTPGEELVIGNTTITSALLGGDFYTSAVRNDKLVYIVEAQEFRDGLGTVVVEDGETVRLVHVENNELEDGDGIVRYL